MGLVLDQEQLHRRHGNQYFLYCHQNMPSVFIGIFLFILAFLVTIELFMYYFDERMHWFLRWEHFQLYLQLFWLWWSFPFIFIAGEASIICTYYLLESKVVWKKILFAIGFSLAFSNFVVNLYPAWQVPLGYLFLVIAIWVIREKWDEIKALNWKQWGIIIISILVSIGLIFSYFLIILNIYKRLCKRHTQEIEDRVVDLVLISVLLCPVTILCL